MAMPYSDKDKQREFQRLYFQRKKKENPKWFRELTKRRKERKNTILDIINQTKRTLGCLMCDEDDPKKLHFHHVIPELKVATVAQMIGNRAKLVVVLKEIEKCVCVCTGCHQLLQCNLSIIRDVLKTEKWIQDWGVSEAFDRIRFHPQKRFKKSNFMEVIKAVVRNSQIEDVKSFTRLRLL